MKCLLCHKDIDKSMVACIDRNFCPFCGGTPLLPDVFTDVRKVLDDAIMGAVYSIGAEPSRVLVEQILNKADEIGYVSSAQKAIEDKEEIRSQISSYKDLNNPKLDAILEAYLHPISGEEPAELKHKKEAAQNAIKDGTGAFKKVDKKDPGYIPVEPDQFKDDQIVPLLKSELKDERIWKIEDVPSILSKKYKSLENIITGTKGMFKRHANE